jgi:response regulator RpfG family c-di-GMP phosphodiesterase
MNRFTQSSILVFSGLALLLAVVSAAFDWRLALGAAAVAGACAVWAALMSTADGRPSQQVCTPVATVPTTLPAAGARPSAPLAVSAPQAEPEPPAAPTPLPVARVDATIAKLPVQVPDLVMPQNADASDVLLALLANARLAGTPVAAHLWLEDVGTPTLRLICAEGPGSPDPTPVPAAEGVLGDALASGAVRCGRIGVLAQGNPFAPGWRFAVPLETDEAAGVAAVDFVGESEPVAAEMDRITLAMCGALTGAFALHLARSEAGTARQLVETASDLSRPLDADEVVDRALRHALALSGGETGSVMLVGDRGSRMQIAKAHGLPDDVVARTLVAEGEGIAGWVLASGRPLVVEDLEHKGPQSRRHGVLSAVSVPISDDEGVLGVLNVGSRRFHARFSRSHVRALEAVGRITATALRNARAATTAQDLFYDTLKALALALETRDPYSRGGTARVVDLSASLGTSLGLDEDDAHALRLAALLHDIGMSAAGEAVAVTNRPLTTVEWGMLKLHPRIAAEILGQAPTLQEVIPVVFHHHEHYDGRGYSSGVAGEDIPLGARILAVADAYVAMTSHRPYRFAMPAAKALAEIRDHSGTQFDPKVVDALIGILDGDPARVAVGVG